MGHGQNLSQDLPMTLPKNWDHNRKLFVRAKGNVSPANIKALAFGFGVRDVGLDPESRKTIQAPHIVWHPQPVDVTSSEAMQAATENKSPATRDAVKNFLIDLLSAGPVLKSEIEEAAEANCISAATLRRAKTDLKISAKKNGFDTGWVWELAEDAHRGCGGKVSTFGRGSMSRFLISFYFIRTFGEHLRRCSPSSKMLTFPPWASSVWAGSAVPVSGNSKSPTSPIPPI
jgi:hypothetical protein